VVTGLEQYSWERAGYFVRRETAPAEALAACLRENNRRGILRLLSESGALATAADLLGPDARVIAFSLLPPETTAWWHRSLPPDEDPFTAGAGTLAAAHACVEICFPLGRDEARQVLPGTHVQPLPHDIAERLRTGENVEGSVTLRLAPGDVLFHSATLVNRKQSGAPAEVWAQLAGPGHWLRRTGTRSRLRRTERAVVPAHLHRLFEP
jgi:hypothetical protein